MLKFEWNALHVGDRVVVHDPDATDFPLLAGTVDMLESKRSKRGINRVGIRVQTSGGRHRVVWPSHLATHHDPPDPAEDCWRCADNTTRRVAAAAAAPPVAVR